MTEHSRYKICFLALMMAVFLPSADPQKAIAGTAVTDSPISGALDDSVWFDADTETVRPVRVAPMVDDSLNRDSRWLPKPKKVKQAAAPASGGTAAGGGGTGGGGVFGSGLSISNLFGWGLLVLLLGLGIGALIFALSKAEIEMAGAAKRSPINGQQSPDEQTIERMKHLPAELRRTDVNLRSEAERLMNAGLFDQAIILLFGHQLLMLDRHGHLRLNRGKTNRRYIRECRSNNANCADGLSKTVDVFERSYFGNKEITPEEFAGLWQNNQRLEQVVEKTPEVAA